MSYDDEKHSSNDDLNDYKFDSLSLLSDDTDLVLQTNGVWKMHFKKVVCLWKIKISYFNCKLFKQNIHKRWNY